MYEMLKKLPSYTKELPSYCLAVPNPPTTSNHLPKDDHRRPRSSVLPILSLPGSPNKTFRRTPWEFSKPADIVVPPRSCVEKDGTGMGKSRSNDQSTRVTEFLVFLSFCDWQFQSLQTNEKFWHSSKPRSKPAKRRSPSSPPMALVSQDLQDMFETSQDLMLLWNALDAMLSLWRMR